MISIHALPAEAFDFLDLFTEYVIVFTDFYEC
jgi:hypothetical protein